MGRTLPIPVDAARCGQHGAAIPVTCHALPADNLTGSRQPTSGLVTSATLARIGQKAATAMTNDAEYALTMAAVFALLTVYFLFS
jgi:hypothetical protein